MLPQQPLLLWVWWQRWPLPGVPAAVRQSSSLALQTPGARAAFACAQECTGAAWPWVQTGCCVRRARVRRARVLVLACC
jgi:hypothetical protein